MTKMVFTNLPVMNLDKSTAFYAALGFTNEPKFTDEMDAGGTDRTIEHSAE